MEPRRRSVAKALSWRVIAMVITALVAWFLTGEFAIALEIGLLDTLIKVGVYYGHERAWLRVPYGKMKPPEYHI